jgi:hypothetical protein
MNAYEIDASVPLIFNVGTSCRKVVSSTILSLYRWGSTPVGGWVEARVNLGAWRRQCLLPVIEPVFPDPLAYSLITIAIEIPQLGSECWKRRGQKQQQGVKTVQCGTEFALLAE